MKKALSPLIALALVLTFFVSVTNGSQAIQRIDNRFPATDLSLSTGRIDYRGSAGNTKKIIEFIISNKSLAASPGTTLIFTRGDQRISKKIIPLKAQKKLKINIVCDYTHGAHDFRAVIALRDANLRNNVVTGVE